MAKMKNCPMCGKVFLATPGRRVCIDCREAEMQREREIVAFVREHPNSTIAEIIEATGASEKMIKRMIEEGRFVEFSQNIHYPCKRCGKLIVAGKYCKSCYEGMQKAIQKAHANQMLAHMRKKSADSKEKEKSTYSDGMKSVIGRLLG